MAQSYSQSLLDELVLSQAAELSVHFSIAYISRRDSPPCGTSLKESLLIKKNNKRKKKRRDLNPGPPLLMLWRADLK